MLFDVAFLLAITLSPLGYIIIVTYLERILVRSYYRDGVVRFHNYLFGFLQLIFAMLSVYYLIVTKMILELFCAMLIIYMMLAYYNTDIYCLYHRNTFYRLRIQIFGILLAPLFLMSLLRNFFDTYSIGLLIFNISNYAILLWECSILSIINITYLCWETGHDIRILVWVVISIYASIFVWKW